MVSEHDQWIAQAVELARQKRFDDARQLALRVVREDGSNPKALWIVASTTASLSERRNALRALLRVQPDNLHARQMLDAMDREVKTTDTAQPSKPTKTSTAIRSIKPDTQPQHTPLYAAVVIAALAIVAAVIIAVRVI